VMMDMARHWGHEQAHLIVARASVRAVADGIGLDAALALDPDVSSLYSFEDLARLVGDPGAYLGALNGVAAQPET